MLGEIETMRLIPVLLVVLAVVLVATALLAYKYYRLSGHLDWIQTKLDQKDLLLNQTNQHCDQRLVFIHHSVGNNWLLEGELWANLVTLGIGVQSASRGTEVGQDTDMNHWLAKFENQSDDIIHFDAHAPGHRSDAYENDIIMFKSCYPNSNIVSEGAEIGDPHSPEKTISNYRATFYGLQKVFARYPEKIFIYVTAPPLVPSRTTTENADRARTFNDWVKAEFVAGYRSETGLDNMFVFDLFDVLVDSSGVLKNEYRRTERDSHPNARGSLAATDAFLEFLRDNKIAGK